MIKKAREITLKHCLQDLCPGSLSDLKISGITQNSKEVVAGDIFCALAGTRGHGLDYEAEAIRRGAAIVLHDGRHSASPQALNQVAIPNLRDKLPQLLHAVYNTNRLSMPLVAVTGTNGKTTTVFLVCQWLTAMGYRPGIIGTVGMGLWPSLSASQLTTGDICYNHRTIAALQQQGANALAMEVSSHALSQERVAGLDFDIAVFTNLTHDHLDYHGDMQRYAQAKMRLFKDFSPQKAVINLDSDYAPQMLAATQQSTEVISYSLQQKRGKGRTILADSPTLTASGVKVNLETSWGDASIEIPLLGLFNVSNFLAAFAVVMLVTNEFDAAMASVSSLIGAPGRMQLLKSKERHVVVDYAHTPDALMNALVALRSHCKGHLWCVFGCGGDRDISKRPKMGKIAETYADHVVITNDNPRSEAPERIAEDILRGFSDSDAPSIILSREEAIAHSIQQASPEDMILIAGKGHEDYQIVGSHRYSFDDKLVAEQYLREVHH